MTQLKDNKDNRRTALKSVTAKGCCHKSYINKDYKKNRRYVPNGIFAYKFVKTTDYP